MVIIPKKVSAQFWVTFPRQDCLHYAHHIEQYIVIHKMICATGSGLVKMGRVTKILTVDSGRHVPVV